MQKKKFSDIENPADRLGALQNTCDKVEEDVPVQYVFTPEEKATMREMCLDLDDKIDVKQEHKKAVTAQVNADLKTLLAEKADYRKKIRMGFTEKKATLYAFADHDNNVMEYYDAEGVFVKSRALAPHERQAPLHIMKAANE